MNGGDCRHCTVRACLCASNLHASKLPGSPRDAASTSGNTSNATGSNASRCGIPAAQSSPAQRYAAGSVSRSVRNSSGVAQSKRPSHSAVTLLATFDLADPAGGGKTYVGIVSTTPFDGFRWTTTSGTELNTAIDSISVSNAPEPETVASMVAGLLGVGAVARARSRRVVGG